VSHGAEAGLPDLGDDGPPVVRLPIPIVLDESCHTLPDVGRDRA